MPNFLPAHILFVLVVGGLCLSGSCQVDDFPPESALPGESKVIEYKSEAEFPTATTELPLLTDSRFAEAVIPSPFGVVQGGADEREREDRPWLRLLMNGPTAPLRTVAFSEDSKRIFAGGQDKSLHVWQKLDAGNDLQKSWIYRRPIYWQVQRGPRGNLFAAAANESIAAFAGYGWSEYQNEIFLADAKSLSFQRLLIDKNKTLQPETITSICVPEKREEVVAIDAGGAVYRWKKNDRTGGWEVLKIRGADVEIDAWANDAELLRRWRERGTSKRMDMTAAGDVFYPEVSEINRATEIKYPTWKLIKWSSEQQSRVSLPLPSQGYPGGIAAVACSADGRRIVTADVTTAGNVYVANGLAARPSRLARTPGSIYSLEFSSSGKVLVVGASNGNAHRLEVWTWDRNASPKLVKIWKTESRIDGCAISPNDQYLAFGQDRDVVVARLDELTAKPQRLKGTASMLESVAFSSESGSYDFSVSLRKGRGQKIENFAFRPADLELQQLAVRKASDWTEASPSAKNWTIRGNTENRTPTWNVVIGGKLWGQVPIATQRGRVSSNWCWIPHPTDESIPAGLAVGTGGQNQIYLFRFTRDNKCELVRQYRGHSGAVTSLGCSSDGKLLISSSLDSTVRIWKMDGALQYDFDAVQNSWGAEFEKAEDPITGKPILVVSRIENDGPMFFKGIRKGDTLDSLTWNAGKVEKSVTTPAEILSQLESGKSDRQLRINSSRGRSPQAPFNLFPAWQPLASMVITVDQEWAFWTPYGYYDASFNGHKIFGWQINKGLEEAPSYFRAAELKEEFERPEVMRQLLSVGNLNDAFAAASIRVPGNLSGRLAVVDRLKPEVDIVLPVSNTTVSGNQLTVAAVITAPSEVKIVPPKAFANGVPAVSRRLVSEKEIAGSKKYSYRWQFRLPGDKRIRLQVIAASEYGHGAIDETMVQRAAPDRDPPGRIYLVAAGINEYGDNIGNLDFAVNNAVKMKQTWLSVTDRLDPRDTTVLASTSMSPSLWNVTMSSIAERLANKAGPNDLIVIFLSGHGVLDEKSGNYFYLTSSSRYRDIVGRRFGDCISFDDFGKLAAIPCRKLVVLDTCHSGAIQTLKQSDLKSVVRALENDLLITITASEGGQEAFESVPREMGVFSSRFIEALRGQCDLASNGGDGDGQVELAEVVSYLREMVPKDAADFGGIQLPTASPKEIIPFIETPLSQATK